MKKNVLFCVLVMILILLLAGCGCSHEWLAATCTAPKTCNLCDKTEGEALGHTWQEVTCTTPKTCSVCQITEGEALDHDWLEATTDEPKTCRMCKITSGSKLQTDPRFTTKSALALQGTWICDITLTDEKMGLVDFGDVECQMTMTFGNTGVLITSVAPTDEEDFMGKYRTYTIDLTYASLAAQGLSKEQADQAMLEVYGLNVPDYVDAALKSFSIADIFAAFHFEEVYYVEDGKVFTALTWNAKFENNTFTITDGELVIDGLTLEEGGPALTWKKA